MRMLPVFVTCLFLLCLWSGSARGGNCGVCHGEQKIAFEASIHAKHDLFCTDCHGGDGERDISTLTGDQRSAACKDHESFRGVVSATRLTELCSRCHSDVEMMRPYRIPTDQLAQYKNSNHGKALYEKGDRNTASCASCHGVHKIFRVKDPRSKAHRWNISKTCADCHSDKSLMAPYKLPTDQWDKYKDSIHGQGLLEKKYRGVPSCAGCHGAHGAAPPGVAQVESTCAYCHPEAKEYFDRSPHKEQAEDGDMKACIQCHGYHGVRPLNASMFLSQEQGGCLDCHEADDAGGVLATNLDKVNRTYSQQIEDARLLIDEAEREGLIVEEEERYLQAARRIAVRLRPAVHASSLTEVEEYLVQGRGTLREIQTSLRAKRKIWRDRKIIALAIAGGLLTLAGCLILYTRFTRRLRYGMGEMAPSSTGETAPERPERQTEEGSDSPA